MTVHVLDTKRWSPQQALLCAQERSNLKAVYIVTESTDGTWETTLGGDLQSPQTLMASEMLRRRAFSMMAKW